MLTLWRLCFNFSSFSFPDSLSPHPTRLPPPLLSGRNSTLTGFSHKYSLYPIRKRIHGHCLCVWCQLRETLFTDFTFPWQRQIYSERAGRGGSLAGEKLLAQGTSGRGLKGRGAFLLSREPIGSHGLKSVGLIGSFRMPANGGNVLGILLSI